MTGRRHLTLMVSVLLLFTLTNYNLMVQLKRAKQDLADARERELESDKYTVQLMNITMYAPLGPGAVEGRDFSGDPSRTASGDKVVPGKTAAAGSNIPFGTRIYVEGIGWRTVNDRGSAIGPGDIDLAVSTIEESVRFGRQQRLVIMEPP